MTSCGIQSTLRGLHLEIFSVCMDERPHCSVRDIAAVATAGRGEHREREAEGGENEARALHAGFLIAERVLGRRCGLFGYEVQLVRGAGFHSQEKGRNSGGQASIDYSIGQREGRLQRFHPQRHFTLLGRIDDGRDDDSERLELHRAEDQRADGRSSSAVDEIVGAEPRELQLRLLDREQVLRPARAPVRTGPR